MRASYHKFLRLLGLPCNLEGDCVAVGVAVGVTVGVAVGVTVGVAGRCCRWCDLCEISHKIVMKFLPSDHIAQLYQLLMLVQSNYVNDIRLILDKLLHNN